MPSEFRGDEQLDRFAEPQTPVVPDDEPQELMEQVLEETLAAADHPGTVGDDLVQAVRAVARNHAGQTLELQPLVVELVRVVLAPRFPSLAGPREPWLTMTARIAESLWEDPASRQRLQSLWGRLQQGEVH